MGRVDGRGARHRDANSTATKIRRKKKPYKVLYENVTQEKKKLRSAVRHSCIFPLFQPTEFFFRFLIISTRLMAILSSQLASIRT